MATIPEAFAIAIQHHQNGRLQAAEQTYRQILAVVPDEPHAIHLLGVIEHQRGKHESAVDYIERAIGLKGNEASFHCNLGEAYRALYRISDAVASYRQALELKPDYAEAHSNLGNAWKDLGKTDESLACYRRALELKPDYAEAHSNLGSASQDLGNFRAAEESYRAALRYNPRFAFAHYKLAELLGGKLADDDLAAQRRLLEQGSAPGEHRALPDAQRLFLHFGLAFALDARGEYADAVENLDRGNAMQMFEWRTRGQAYDPQNCERFVNEMIAACTPDFFERVRDFGSASEIPVFIVGLPRSGTTLIEQILASHSQVFGAGEIKLVLDAMAALGGQGVDSAEHLQQLDRETAHDLASQYLESLRALNSTALRIVDKLPENYLHLGLLASLFLRARFIHCRRDLRDVAVSCWMTHFRDVRWASDQQHIASRFHQYQRMMEHWRNVLPVPLLEIDYEETVADLEGVARKLIEFCGLPWEPGCLKYQRTKRPVRTASAVQVRQPIYTTSVGRWRHYEQLMPTLLSAIPDGGGLYSGLSGIGNTYAVQKRPRLAG
jgi:tetratricopeptide (TPR) repeat protein